MSKTHFGLLTLALTCAACGSSDEGGNAPHNTTPDDPNPPLLEPPEEGHGIQLTMKTSIDPGSEVEHCRFVESGDEDLFVNHDEIRFSQGSHHVLLYKTAYDSIPTENDFGEPVDTSKVFDCSSGAQNGFTLAGLIGGSQSFRGDSLLALPEGVGVKVPAHSVLMINAHYINTTPDVLEPDVYINLHSIPEAELEHEGGLIFWYNPFLKVPAGGTSSMTASCIVDEDIHISNVQSHMHARGVGYKSELFLPSGDVKTVYTGTAWEDVVVKTYSPTLDVPAGSRIEWTCDYENGDSHDIYQGTRTTDEMCMLIGSFYPRNDRIGFCTPPDAPDEQFMGATWHLGKGTKTCAETFQCIAGATSEPSADPVAGITDCMLESDPAVAEPLSALLSCTAVSGGDPSACGDQLATCQAM